MASNPKVIEGHFRLRRAGACRYTEVGTKIFGSYVRHLRLVKKKVDFAERIKNATRPRFPDQRGEGRLRASAAAIRRASAAYSSFRCEAENSSVKRPILWYIHDIAAGTRFVSPALAILPSFYIALHNSQGTLSISH
jgi:hypothetical protein